MNTSFSAVNEKNPRQQFETYSRHESKQERRIIIIMLGGIDKFKTYSFYLFIYHK